MNVSPAKNELRTNGTVRSTRGLSCGRRTRAGSTWKPRLWAYSTNAWFNRGANGSASSTTADRLSGITVREHATEEPPRRFEPVDHVLGGLTERQPHEAMPRVAGREDQRLHHPPPPRLRVDEEPHPAEVDLQLIARLPIGDAHRRPTAPAAAAHLQQIALHRAQRHHYALPVEQLMDLHPGQIVGHPAGDLLVPSGQQPPRRAVTVAAVRTDRLHDHPDEHIGQLTLAAVTLQTELLGGGDVTADRLAVHLRQPLHRPEPFPGQPQPEHFSNLEHTDLPECHGRLSEPVGGNSGQCTLNGTDAGGPSKVVPSLALRWSHATGATQPQVVPCDWRATISVAYSIADRGRRRITILSSVGSWIVPRSVSESCVS